MDKERILAVLREVQSGGLTPQKALERFTTLTGEDLGYAVIDHHRELRRGFPEVIFGEGKTPEQVRGLMERLMAGSSANIMASRVNEPMFAYLKKHIPQVSYYPVARMAAVVREEPKEEGLILVVCAGTSDLPVAEEAVVTAQLMGNRVERLYDVGVAGLHRLLAAQERLRQANVLIVAAGMEGALPTVVGGLTDKPLIAVPTSVGYGAAFGGLAALLSMLNSCASGVTVVNIDNGFGAGYAASTINLMVAKAARKVQSATAAE
ncbi:MAG: nickel pincer cofactor biosynthesis protein LarB [Clostridiales bacterium]|nr:nickel pincer cofactor biosynthesis protein LarB [Clostridiales bacterium]